MSYLQRERERDKEREGERAKRQTNVKHALWDECGQFADFFVDIISSPAFDSIVGFPTTTALFTGNGGLFVGSGLSRRRRRCRGVWMRGRDDTMRERKILGGQSKGEKVVRKVRSGERKVGRRRVGRKEPVVRSSADTGRDTMLWVGNDDGLRTAEAVVSASGAACRIRLA